MPRLFSWKLIWNIGLVLWLSLEKELKSTSEGGCERDAIFDVDKPPVIYHPLQEPYLPLKELMMGL